MTEEIDSFVSMFNGPPGDKQREIRKTRMQKERRTQLTEKQRRRGATRTEQINFRCSPEFRKQVAKLTKQLDISIADLLERALELLATEQGREGHI
jgi:predicted HicB family RNase H-like nuclease